MIDRGIIASLVSFRPPEECTVAPGLLYLSSTRRDPHDPLKRSGNDSVSRTYYETGRQPPPCFKDPPGPVQFSSRFPCPNDPERTALQYLHRNTYTPQYPSRTMNLNDPSTPFLSPNYLGDRETDPGYLLPLFQGVLETESFPDRIFWNFQPQNSVSDSAHRPCKRKANNKGCVGKKLPLTVRLCKALSPRSVRSDLSSSRCHGVFRPSTSCVVSP